MPRKVRELRSALRKAGFERRPSRRGHSIWVHPEYPGSVVVSGNDGDDAKRYQEDEVREAIERAGGRP